VQARDGDRQRVKKKEEEEERLHLIFPLRLAFLSLLPVVKFAVSENEYPPFPSWLSRNAQPTFPSFKLYSKDSDSPHSPDINMFVGIHATLHAAFARYRKNNLSPIFS